MKLSQIFLQSNQSSQDNLCVWEEKQIKSLFSHFLQKSCYSPPPGATEKPLSNNIFMLPSNSQLDSSPLKWWQFPHLAIWHRGNTAPDRGFSTPVPSGKLHSLQFYVHSTVRPYRIVLQDLQVSTIHSQSSNTSIKMSNTIRYMQMACKMYHFQIDWRLLSCITIYNYLYNYL